MQRPAAFTSPSNDRLLLPGRLWHPGRRSNGARWGRHRSLHHCRARTAATTRIHGVASAARIRRRNAAAAAAIRVTAAAVAAIAMEQTTEVMSAAVATVAAAAAAVAAAVATRAAATQESAAVAAIATMAQETTATMAACCGHPGNVRRGSCCPCMNYACPTLGLRPDSSSPSSTRGYTCNLREKKAVFPRLFTRSTREVRSRPYTRTYHKHGPI